jgi:hypothetical protein
MIAQDLLPVRRNPDGPLPEPRAGRAEAGTAVVEFALLLPALFTLVVVTLNFGLIAAQRVAIETAAAEAALGATAGYADTDPVAVAQAIVEQNRLEALPWIRDASWDYSHIELRDGASALGFQPALPWREARPPRPRDPGAMYGRYIEVTVRSEARPLFPSALEGVTFPSISLEATHRARLACWQDTYLDQDPCT